MSDTGKIKKNSKIREGGDETDDNHHPLLPESFNTFAARSTTTNETTTVSTSDFSKRELTIS